MLGSFTNKINVVVIGASGGIGRALTEELAQLQNVKTLYTFSRSNIKFNNPKVSTGTIDLSREQSIEAAAKSISHPLDLVLIASGILHDETMSPEKSLRDLNMDAFQKSFAVNTFGPALIAKHFLPLLPREGKSVFAAISARIGSISDNQLGGWYAYRASKAALNMLIKTASIEISRRHKNAAVIGLHPGTVDTKLSSPFHSNVHHEILTPQQSASYLLNVIDQITAKDSGKIFAWDGSEVLP